MNSSNLTSLLLLVCLFLGCNQEEVSPITDSDFEINFQIERFNSNENYTSQVESITLNSKSSSWQINYDERLQLIKEIEFELNLENGKTLDFGLWFKKNETDQDLLILEDQNAENWGERAWDYKSTEIEKENFYRGFDEARLMINNTVAFHGKINDGFDIIEVEQVLVNGEEKSYITLDFNGKTFGWYDPSGEFMNYYQISEGSFKGIIE